MSPSSKGSRLALPLLIGLLLPTLAAASPPTPKYQLPSSGPRDAQVTVAYFFDFQCPFSARSLPVIRQLQDLYAGDLRVLYLHRPLRFHPHAEPAARAAWAAWRQGAFEPMFERLMKGQKQLGTQSYRRWARELGLDVDRFTADMGSAAAGERIRRDAKVADILSIRSTPGFLINGIRISGHKPLARLRAVVDQELARTAMALRGGIDRNDLHAERVRRNQPSRSGRYIAWLIRGELPPLSAAAGTGGRRAGDDTIWKVPLGPEDGLLGAADGIVKMVLFTDYQCPFCGRLDATVRKLVAEFPQLEVRIKHLPLSFHKDARPAARAAICAGKQGRFAAMHRALFADQRRLKRPDLLRRARKIGLSVPSFKRCLDAAATDRVVAEHLAQARRAGARGTPTSFINGRKAIGAKPLATFRRLVRERLAFAPAELARAGISAKTAKPSAATALYRHQQRRARSVAAPRKRPAGKRLAFQTAGRPSLGNARRKDAEVVVFLELSCPFCTRLLPTLMRLARKRPKIRIAVLHYPLSRRCNPHVSTDFHPTACRGAAWAEAAHAQRRFPAFLKAVAAAGTLTGKRPRAADKPLLAAARAAGLKLRRLNRYVSRGKHRRGLAHDIAQARAAGVRGTPTLFIHGQQVTGRRDLAKLIRLVDKRP